MIGSYMKLIAETGGATQYLGICVIHRSFIKLNEVLEKVGYMIPSDLCDS